DRLPRPLHSARERRPTDSVPPPCPSPRLPASNRAPDDPPRKILPTTCFEGYRSPRQPGAKVASREAKIKRHGWLKRASKSWLRPVSAYRLIGSRWPQFISEVAWRSARPRPAFAD